MDNQILYDYNTFVETHKPQLIISDIPELYWKSLFEKLKNQIFDAGEFFVLLLNEFENEMRRETDIPWQLAVSNEEGIKSNDPNAIFLIDHAWNFRGVDKARRQLQQIPGLINRMASLMVINTEEYTSESLINEVLRQMWKYINTYSLNAEGLKIEDRMPIFFILDEVGSGIHHSETPNVRVVPFIHIPEKITYSLLFPIVDIDESTFITRNFVEGSQYNEKERQALLLPWKYSSFLEEDYTQTEPNLQYFLEGHIQETLSDNVSMPEFDGNRPIKVYSDYDLINTFLTDPSFEIVTDEKKADILWYTKHFKGYKELSEESPNTFINQFPYENVLTIKDLLSVICRRGNEKSFFPITYNLKTELVKFVSYFQNRSRDGLDNHWIVKPWNLARSLDTHITNDISYLMRLPLTGPKIVQKYIDKPVLFDRPEVLGRVKFDIRYVILLRSVDPIDCYIYKNFFLRFANKPFQLNNFDDYEQHFTVMNYSDFILRHIPCAEFLELWQEQYPNFSWFDIETNICKMFKEMLNGATNKKPPAGIGNNLQSRSLYAADLMLEWNNDGNKITPKLLEINWTPDCKRACDYYPDFYNDIFKLLFLDQINDDLFRRIV